MHMCTWFLNYGIKLLILICSLSSPFCVFQNNLTNIYTPTTQAWQILTAQIFASDPDLKIR